MRCSRRWVWGFIVLLSVPPDHVFFTQVSSLGVIPMGLPLGGLVGPEETRATRARWSDDRIVGARDDRSRESRRDVRLALAATFGISRPAAPRLPPHGYGRSVTRLVCSPVQLCFAAPAGQRRKHSWHILSAPPKSPEEGKRRTHRGESDGHGGHFDGGGFDGVRWWTAVSSGCRNEPPRLTAGGANIPNSQSLAPPWDSWKKIVLDSHWLS